MGEPKAFASLSSGLLARKGGARPAMRPQGFGGQTGAGLEDLGWNDMGFEPPKPANLPERDAEHDGFGDEVPEQPLRNPLAALTPVQSPVHSQHAEIANRLSDRGEDYSDEGEEEEEADETAELYEAAVSTEAVRPNVETLAAEPVLVEPVAAPIAIAVAAPVRAAAPRRSLTPRAAPGSKARAAFTLRLDPERHMKLRLACAVGGRSAQLLVTDALDALLASMPELDAMASKANRKG